VHLPFGSAPRRYCSPAASWPPAALTSPASTPRRPSSTRSPTRPTQSPPVTKPKRDNANGKPRQAGRTHTPAHRPPIPTASRSNAKAHQQQVKTLVLFTSVSAVGANPYQIPVKDDQTKALCHNRNRSLIDRPLAAGVTAEVGWLRAEKTRLATERDILRSAAKYFAGETNW
jgi:hypothetical protein